MLLGLRIVDTCVSDPSTESVKPPEPSESEVVIVTTAPLIAAAKLMLLVVYPTPAAA